MYYNENHNQKVLKRKDNYKYIGSYRANEITIDGKCNKRKVFIRVKCPYCGKEYDIRLDGFQNGNKCTNCCNEYENSFAYYIQQELQEPLNKYWDWEENNKLGINPYLIYKTSRKQIWIKCDKIDYHDNYKTTPASFTIGNRCPYCSHNSGKVHPKDSFGALYPDKTKYWSPNNKKSPYETTAKSGKKYKFICEECGNEFKISPHELNRRGLGVLCNDCNSYKGEFYIKKWLNENNIYYIHNRCYFDDLTGVNGGKLKPDFILPDYKIWIEYDGEQHFEWQETWMSKEKFETLQKHDRIKDEYAKKHNWKIIRIPYWDFNNMNIILEGGVS